MAASIGFVTVLNDHYELKSMPVSEDIRLLFSNKPDMRNIEAFISLVRIDESIKSPSEGEWFNSNPGFVPFGYETVDVVYSLEEMSGKWKVTLSPKRQLIPNSEYRVLLSKNLAPEYYTVTKETSLGDSSIYLKSDEAGLGANASYEMTITSGSYISGSSHIVGYSLVKNGNVVTTGSLIDINSKTISIGNGDQIVLDPSKPFAAGELFLVTTSKYSRLGEDYAEEVFTALSDKSLVTEQENSKRLENADILKFYEKHAWLTKAHQPEAPVENPFKKEVIAEVEYTDINQFIIKLPSDTNFTAFEASSIAAKFTYVFKNYLIKGTALYNKDNKYILKYSILEGEGVLITVELNPDPLAIDKYIVEEE